MVSGSVSVVSGQTRYAYRRRAAAEFRGGGPSCYKLYLVWSTRPVQGVAARKPVPPPPLLPPKRFITRPCWCAAGVLPSSLEIAREQSRSFFAVCCGQRNRHATASGPLRRAGFNWGLCRGLDR